MLIVFVGDPNVHPNNYFHNKMLKLHGRIKLMIIFWSSLDEMSFTIWVFYSRTVEAGPSSYNDYVYDKEVKWDLL
jgi:hypothetical protein